MRGWILAALLAGCSEKPLYLTTDAGIDEEEPLKPHCYGPKDEGREVYWIGFPMEGYNPHRVGRVGYRYVCIDHGRDHHGYWFEARPE